MVNRVLALFLMLAGALLAFAPEVPLRALLVVYATALYSAIVGFGQQLLAEDK